MVVDFQAYQKKALETAIYPDRGENIIYPTLGLAGEAGELCNKVKKLLRDGKTLDEVRDDLISELGDCLWYISAIAYELNVPLALVADLNVVKLGKRAEKGTLGGSGDQR